MVNVGLSLQCSGCSACIDICPVKCIEFTTNEKGFYCVKVNNEKCIRCGKCMEICPIIKPIEPRNKIRHSYIAVSRDKEIYERSSSGGIFSEIAKVIIHNKGFVWGCQLDRNLVAKHICIKNYENIDEIRRSKYVQSNMYNVYNRIKSQLETETKVLFAGTPCQVAGLYRYLGKGYENLYTMDLICHGVPSPQMFQDNVQYIEKKRNKKLLRYEFRLKNNKQKNQYYYYICYKDGTEEYRPYYYDAYFSAFYDLLTLNDCCYECPYASVNRIGDITVGDYSWGSKWHPNFNAFHDISCILVNSEKGGMLFQQIEKNIIAEETKLEHIMENNHNLYEPAKYPKLRDGIYAEIAKKGYGQWAEQYFKSKRFIKKMPIYRYLSEKKKALKKVLLKKQYIRKITLGGRK